MSDALERSVLENKDREQLITIAGALGLRTTARSKKGDIIDKILESTGAGAPVAPIKAPRVVKPKVAKVAPDTVELPLDAPVVVAPPQEPEPTAAAAPAPALDVPVESTAPAVPAPADAAPVSERLSARAPVPTASRPVPAPPVDRSAGPISSGFRSNGPGQSATGPRSSYQAGGYQAGGNGRLQPQAVVAPAVAAPVVAAGNGPSNPNANGNGNGNQISPNSNGDNDNDTNADGTESEGRRKRRRNRNRNRAEGGPGNDDVDQSLPPMEITPLVGFGDPVEVAGYLDLRDEGYGFLRVNGYLPSRDDAYVSVKQSRQLGLRKGDHVTGTARPAGRNEKNPALLSIETVNGQDPELARNRRRFEDLTPLFPDSKLTLENPGEPYNMTTRIIDLIAPIGKGQRGLIVSPPKAGKTSIMKSIATAIEKNHPEVKLIVLLIDERPEEVTDMRRTVKGEVMASTFDRPSEEHTHLAELCIERAKRMVEGGDDVVIILDGITRLARAYNLAVPPTGKIMSGGIDAGALYPPKKFFGAARNVEEGGSLTILATALVDTNSRMDDAIFEEFKGTGNMELRLDRRLAERRVFPAIDVDGSSTRHEELLFERKQVQIVWKLRKVLHGLAEAGSGQVGLELLMDRLKTFRTNAEFLAEVAKQP